MSETLNPIMQDMARQIAKAVIEQVSAAVEEMRAEPPVATPWMKEAEAAAYLGVKPRGIQTHRRHGTGPNYCMPGGVIRYNRAELDSYMRDGEVVPGAAS